MKTLTLISCLLLILTVNAFSTTVSIDGTQWRIDGKITFPGTEAEGLLMNVRMVNSTFEDRSRFDFDVDENTNRFIAKIPEYKQYGVLAVTLNLQGGMPGYEGAVNTAIRRNGGLWASYMQRVKRVIDACNQNGMVVILGLFYQRQDQFIRDEDSVRKAVVNTVNWVKENGFQNVVIEIANEYNHRGFDHEIIHSNEGEVELIKLAKETAPDLLVSTSGLGNGRMAENVAEAVDFILIHFNGTTVEDIPARIIALKQFNKPIVCNEDDKIGEEAAKALKASVANGCSWGYMYNQLNQYQPFEFNGYNDDPVMYDTMKMVTSK